MVVIETEALISGGYRDIEVIINGGYRVIEALINGSYRDRGINKCWL